MGKPDRPTTTLVKRCGLPGPAHDRPLDCGPLATASQALTKRQGGGEGACAVEAAHLRIEFSDFGGKQRAGGVLRLAEGNTVVNFGGHP